MHLNLFTQCSPSPQFKGFWRHPADRSATGYRDLGYWVELGRRLEAACLDALFFADVHGTYDVYQGSWRAAVRHAVQIPSIDPLLVLPAIAATTSRLGLAVTYSTTYHTPYECARVFSSLDHLTGGRVAWNIVTSYLRSASANGLGSYLDHDERYDRADEYVEVARRLWEESWDDDAVLRDVAANVFTDPDRVREIGHEDAGSPCGARTSANRRRSAPRCCIRPGRPGGDDVRGPARRGGVPDHGGPGQRRVAGGPTARRGGRARRDPRSVKALQGSMVMVAPTRAEARRRAEEYVALWSGEGQLAKWCGWMDVDLAAYPDETPVAEIAGQGSQSFVGFLRRLGPERTWTVGDVRYLVATARRPRTRSAGDPLRHGRAGRRPDGGVVRGGRCGRFQPDPLPDDPGHRRHL